MYPVLFELAGIDHLQSIERVKAIIYGGTEFLAFCNLEWLIENPGTPRLYQIAPKYDLKVRPLAFDAWYDLVRVYELRQGDCKDFVAIRLAEERKAGNIQCSPFVTHKDIRDPATGEIYRSFHVQLMNGRQLEDPALKLGMPTDISLQDIRRLFHRR